MTGKWTPGPTRETGQGRAGCGDSRGERGKRLGFTRGGTADSADPVERLPAGVINAADATLRKDGGDARHSVPDCPRPGTARPRPSAANPTFSDKFFHLSVSLSRNFHHQLLKPLPGHQRPSGDAPWWGSVAALPVGL